MRVLNVFETRCAPLSLTLLQVKLKALIDALRLMSENIALVAS